MKTDDTEQHLADRLRQQLRAGDETIDELTAARLKAARLQALDSTGKGRARYLSWWSAGGLATATVVLLAVMLLPVDVELPVTEPGLMKDDWELLAEGDLQLIEELDFYDWLPEEDTTG